MQKFKALALALFLTAFAVQASAQDKTLYERLGGGAAISAVR
jgi:hypothetical protein